MEEQRRIQMEQQRREAEERNRAYMQDHQKFMQQHNRPHNFASKGNVDMYGAQGVYGQGSGQVYGHPSSNGTAT
jgi:hypothetical protein